MLTWMSVPVSCAPRLCVCQGRSRTSYFACSAAGFLHSVTPSGLASSVPYRKPLPHPHCRSVTPGDSGYQGARTKPAACPWISHFRGDGRRPGSAVRPLREPGTHVPPRAWPCGAGGRRRQAERQGQPGGPPARCTSPLPCSAPFGVTPPIRSSLKHHKRKFRCKRCILSDENVSVCVPQWWPKSSSRRAGCCWGWARGNAAPPPQCCHKPQNALNATVYLNKWQDLATQSCRIIAPPKPPRCVMPDAPGHSPSHLGANPHGAYLLPSVVSSFKSMHRRGLEWSTEETMSSPPGALPSERAVVGTGGNCSQPLRSHVSQHAVLWQARALSSAALGASPVQGFSLLQHPAWFLAP